MTKKKPIIEVLIKCDGKDFAHAVIDGRNISTDHLDDSSYWTDRKEKSKIFQKVKLFARDQQDAFADPKFLD